MRSHHLSRHELSFLEQHEATQHVHLVPGRLPEQSFAQLSLLLARVDSRSQTLVRGGVLHRRQLVQLEAVVDAFCSLLHLNLCFEPVIVQNLVVCDSGLVAATTVSVASREVTLLEVEKVLHERPVDELDVFVLHLLLGFIVRHLIIISLAFSHRNMAEQVTNKSEVEDSQQQEQDKDLRAEFNTFMEEMRQLSSDNNKYTQEYQLDRLLNNEFVNPYDILELTQEANDAEIKKKFKQLSILIHPDKCSHERASDAFHVLE